MSRYTLIIILFNLAFFQAYRPEGYIGCFKDWRNRILEGKHRVSRTNSGDECIRYCKEDGYRYAGTQARDECYCGHRLKAGVNSTGCNQFCAGNYNEICGGHWRISVYDIRKDTTSSMTTSQMNKSKNTIRKQINNETPTQKESSIPVISTYTATSEETTLLSTYQVTTNDHTSMEAETNTLATTNEVGLSTEKEKTNSNRTIDKTSHLAIIMPVLLILTGTIIIVISVIVFKKRRHERGKNVYHGDHEPPEQVTYENCESPKASVKRNNSYIVNDAARQPDPSYINTEREAQPDDVSYEMLQLNGKSITEYTTIDLHSTCTDGNTAQVGNYEVLNKESQHQFLYSEINSKC